MSETNSEVYTPVNPTLGYSQEQPVSIETLPPQDYVDTNAEEDKEGSLNMSIRGADHPSNMLNPDRMATENSLTESLNGFNNQSTAPEVKQSDLPETTPEEQLISQSEKVEYDIEQQKNIEIMMRLLEKYPHAFTKYTTNDGRDYSVLKLSGLNTEYKSIDHREDSIVCYEDVGIVLSYKGVEKVEGLSSRLLNSNQYDLTPVLDAEDIGIIDEHYDEVEGHLRETAFFSLIEDGPKLLKPKFLRYFDVRLDTLKSIITDAEKAHENDPIPEKNTAKDVLASL